MGSNPILAATTRENAARGARAIGRLRRGDLQEF